MKKLPIINLIIVLFLALGLSSCAVIGDIFEAGMWTALIGVIIIIAAVIWLLKKIF